MSPQRQSEKAAPAETPKLAEELEKMPYEPLLPIEKKLILGSLALGIFLLAVLVGINQFLFR